MISYIIPTRNRHEMLASTLQRLGSLPRHRAEVIIIDNASTQPAAADSVLPNGIPVQILHRATNEGTAARNVGARASDPSSSWLIMLDDDSYPLNTSFLANLATRTPSVAAVMADIHLPRLKKREDGGLPEVFIGCGVAIRRDAFLRCSGYDPAFGYYVEEYDLAAKLILKNYHIEFDPNFQVHHLKDNLNRDMNLICERLVRNNGWVMQRYSPEEVRRQQLREIRSRYRRIAAKENAIAGFSRGLIELRNTIQSQTRRPMTTRQFERFIGLSAAREGLSAAFARSPFHSATLVNEGKNASVIRAAMYDLGIRESLDGEARIIGTMSPGPMLDAAQAHSDWIAPWSMAQPRSRSIAA